MTPEKRKSNKKYRDNRSIRHKALLQKIKSETPCSDCGHSYPFYVMQFDHVRGKKYRGLSYIHCFNVGALKRELEKCEVVCANCHAIRNLRT